MNQSSFINYVLHQPYDIPTFKTNALRLVSNEGWVKHMKKFGSKMEVLLAGAENKSRH